MMNDFYEGEKRVKLMKTIYLPMTPGMILDQTSNDTIRKQFAEARYDNYLSRAVFYTYFSDTVDASVGIINVEDFDEVTIPDELKYIIEDATPFNESLHHFNSILNREQLKTGRAGILVQPTLDGKVKLNIFKAHEILNWDYEIVNGSIVFNFIVLRTNKVEMSGLESKIVHNYTILALDEEGYYYEQSYTDDNLNMINIQAPSAPLYPMLNGNKLRTIPFVFVNSTSLNPDPEKPMLLDLVYLVKHIYQNSADLQQYLFESGQNTLFAKCVGADDDDGSPRLGSGSMIVSSDKDADLKYVGIDGSSLNNMSDILENMKTNAMNMGINLISSASNSSGKALETRVFIQSASIRTVANTAAQALTRALNVALIWMGKEPTAIIKPNTRYSTINISIDDLEKLWNANKISDESIHNYLRKLGVVDVPFTENQ
jgi:hypothetical protein